MPDFSVESQDEFARLDALIAAKLENVSRSHAQKLIEDNSVLLDGKPAGKNTRVKVGQTVSIIDIQSKELDILPQDIPIEIMYEDDSLLVVNKQKGLVVHPAPGNPDGTLVNALLYYCKDRLSGINGVLRPGIVHRLDKDTSGLLIVAKNDIAHTGLAAQIAEHSFYRRYEAVVSGVIKQDSGKIEQPIGRSLRDRKKMTVTLRNSKEAVTHYEVLQRFTGFTHTGLRLETGRTHQIRVHMAHIGHPVAGDEVYGNKKKIPGLTGQCLHAKEIGFIHPVTGESMSFNSELPDYFKAVLNKLK